MYFVPPHNCINKLFSEENKVPEHCLKLERWQGPPHVNKVKRCEIVSSFTITLFIQSWKQNQSRKIFWFKHPLWKLQSAPSSDKISSGHNELVKTNIFIYKYINGCPEFSENMIFKTWEDLEDVNLQRCHVKHNGSSV